MIERDELERRLAALEAEDWDGAAPPPLDMPRALEARPAKRRGAAGWLPGRPRFAGAGRAPAGRPPRGPLLLRPAVAAGLAALLLAVGFAGGAALTGAGDDGSSTAGRPVGLTALAPARGSAHATARLAADTVTLDVADLPRSHAGQYYELWAMRSAQRLVSLGTFRVGADGRAHLRIPLTVDLKRFPVLDISIEPADGNPAHSSVSVLRSKPIPA